MTIDQLSFREIDAALQRCMAVHTPMAPDFEMHADAAHMSGAWATLVVTRAPSIAKDQVSAAALEAIARWTTAGSVQGD